MTSSRFAALSAYGVRAVGTVYLPIHLPIRAFFIQEPRPWSGGMNHEHAWAQMKGAGEEVSLCSQSSSSKADHEQLGQV